MKELTSKSFRFIPAALCLVLALLANNAKAAPSYWDINGTDAGAGGATPSGTWESAFWSTDSTGASATANWSEGDFPEFAAGTDATGSYTVTANANHTIAGMLMNTSSGTVTINGTGILSIAAGYQGFFSTGTLQINSVLGGTGGYEGQSGTVQLYGINTYSGGSLLNGNLTYFNNASSFGSGPITPVFVGSPGYSAMLSSGGALITLPNNFVISTLNAGINFASSASTPVTCTGTWDLQQTLFLRNNGNSTAPLTLSGILSDVGGLTVSANNTGTTLLSGANTYSGGTSIIQGSSGHTVQIGNASALGTGAASVASGCVLDLNGTANFNIGSTLTLNGAGISSGGVLINSSSTAASLSSSTPVTLASASSMGGAGNLTLNGVVSGSFALTKVGVGGTLTLNGANTFNGLIVSGGGVAVGNSSAIGLSTGTINFNTSPTTIASTSGTAYSFSNPLTLGASSGGSGFNGVNEIFGAPGTGNLTFSGNANSGTTTTKIIEANGITVTFSGVISGTTISQTLGWAGTNGGVIVLSGANTYTKTNILFSGTVQVAHSESANASGPLGKATATAAGNIVFSGGTLQYASANNHNDYSGRFSTAASQAYNIDVNGQAVTFATALTSSGGSLTLSDTAGGGTLTLSSAGNTYAGGTTINAGTLEVSGSVAGNVTVNGGVLKLDNTTALASTADLTLPATPSGNVNLNLSGGTQNIGALYFGSTPQATGTWGASGSGAAHISSAFTGNGLLNVTCAGLVQTITPTASSVCANSTGNTASVTITAGATYAWSITGGTISSDPTQPIITYTAGASGTVHLSCIVTSSGGCASPGLQNTPVAISTTIPAQTITPTASSVCANSTGNTASVTSTPGATYAWSIAGGTIPGSSTSQTVTYTAGASGTVTLNCIVSSSVGCASAGGQNTTVTINTCGPVPPAVQITNIVYNAGTATITGTGVVNTANWFLKASPTVNAPLPWTTTITSGGPITVNPFTATDPDAGSVSQRFYYLTNNPN